MWWHCCTLIVPPALVCSRMCNVYKPLASLSDSWPWGAFRLSTSQRKASKLTDVTRKYLRGSHNNSPNKERIFNASFITPIAIGYTWSFFYERTGQHAVP